MFHSVPYAMENFKSLLEWANTHSQNGDKKFGPDINDRHSLVLLIIYWTLLILAKKPVLALSRYDI